METKLYKPASVAAMLGVSKSMMYKMMRAGEVPVVALSPRCLRIPIDALEKYLKDKIKDPEVW